MRLGRLLDYIRRAAPPESRDMTDGQLLSRFVAAGDEDCFIALVARHGPMVLAACRRLLRHEQDAEDAFQAVFLVLARKANSLRWNSTVGPWLHEVANRTALEARAIRARRRVHEIQSNAVPHPLVEPTEPQDWRPLLDRELNRLPLKYRAAIILCELQGQTRSEAAAQLGVPEGTLSSRLAKGKELLARRLARLNPAASLAGVAAAAVPPDLIASTVSAALLVSAGSEVPAVSAAIMKGVLKAMFLTKLKVASVVVLVAALGGGGFVYQVGKPAEAQAQPQAQPPKPLSEVEALRRENELLKLNLEVVLKEVRSLKAEVAELKGAGKKSSDDRTELSNLPMSRTTGKEKRVSDTLAELERSLKAIRDGGDRNEYRRVIEALDKALRRLKDSDSYAPGPNTSPSR
jgi:RNA polymerase sigma factor (sigma-70 family)